MSRILSLVVGDDVAGGEDVPGLGDAVGKRLSGFVVGEAARVGNGQHRDADRDEGAALVNPGHCPRPPCFASPRRTSRAGGRGSSARRALPTLPVSNRPKQVAPEPDMRAKPRRPCSSAGKRLADRRARSRAAAGSRSLRVLSASRRRLWKSSCAAGAAGRGCLGWPARGTPPACETATPGLTSTRPSAGKSGTGRRALADAAGDQRLCRQAHRHVGAERGAEPRQLGVVGVQPPGRDSAAQRRRRVARSAADARRDGQVLLQLDRDRRQSRCGQGGRAAHSRAAITRFCRRAARLARTGPARRSGRFRPARSSAGRRSG